MGRWGSPWGFGEFGRGAQRGPGLGSGLSTPIAAAASPLGVTRMGQPCQPRASVSPRDHPGVLGGPPMSPAKPAWAFSSEVCNSQMLTLQKKLCAERQNSQQGLGGGSHRGCARRWLKDLGFARRIGHTQGCATAPITHMGSPCSQIPRAVTKLPDLTPCSFLGAVPGRVGAAAGPPVVTAAPLSCRFQVRAAPKTKHHGIDPIQRLAHGHAQLPQK